MGVFKQGTYKTKAGRRAVVARLFEFDGVWALRGAIVFGNLYCMHDWYVGGASVSSNSIFDLEE